MPPVMGLIAFFMAEILGVSYWSVCVAALIPALLYYFVLYVQIHYEAVRLNLRGLAAERLPSLKDAVMKNWYYLLPALLLVYLLAVKDLPVQLCGLYALLSVVLISFIDWFRGRVAGGTWKGLGAWMADCVETGTRSLIVPAMATASAGGRRWWCIIRAGGLIATAVIGFTPTAAGIGIQIMRGASRFITVAGSTARATAGAGGRTRFGRRHGSRGVPARLISPVLRCRTSRPITPD